MVSEATVDCHDETEAVGSFVTVVEERLAVPLGTQVLGAGVATGGAGLAEDCQIVEVCSRGRSRRAVRFREPAPPGRTERVEAYRLCAAGARGA